MRILKRTTTALAAALTLSLAGAATAAPRLDDVMTDVDPAGMYQGRILTIEFLGASFGSTAGRVDTYDCAGSFLFSLDGSFPGLSWDNDHVLLTIDEQFTAGYTPGNHCYDFELVDALGRKSNRDGASFRVWSVPRQNEWTFYGPATTGLKPKAGGWDARLNGMISPAAVVKKNGTFYLYYIGASGDRQDGGPAYRSLGVATSTDGIRFTKKGKVIDVADRDEEGVFSAAAVVHDGKIVLYYSRCVEVSPGDVACDGFRATSWNGINFSNHQKVLDHRNGALDGHGNELFPVGVVNDAGLWVVSYVWKNAAGTWFESSAWSANGVNGWTSGRLINPTSRGGMANTDLVKLPGNHVLVAGVRTQKSWPDYKKGAIVELHSATYFTDMAKLGFEYRFGNIMGATTYYDASTQTWYLYGLEYSRSETCAPGVTCHRASGISVRTAKTR